MVIKRKAFNSGNTKWTSDSIKKGMADMEFLNSTFVKRKNRSLYEAAIRHYGTWIKALLANGYDNETEKAKYRNRKK